MKFIHTGDWHLGKIVNQVSMLADQAHILAQFVALVARERPAAVLLAGDLYDRAVPPAEAVELMDRVLTTLVNELRVPVLAVAGNHDGPDRIDFGRRLLCGRQLHLTGRIRLPMEPVVLQDEAGPVACYLLPYAHPAEVRALLGDDTVKTHEDAVRALLGTLPPPGPGERRVLVTHGYFQGSEPLETSESEKPLSIGGSDVVSAGALAGFQYVALGHLHGPQRVNDCIHYAGSLLKYSFSEVRQAKSVTIVELDAAGGVAVRREQLAPRRDMRRIQGELKALLDPAVYGAENVDDYLTVRLTDEGELLDPIGQLRSVYPNVMAVERMPRELQPLYSQVSMGEVKSAALETLFKGFYEEMTGVSFSAARQAVVEEALEKLLHAEREA